jgi:hypothetical protein
LRFEIRTAGQLVIIIHENKHIVNMQSRRPEQRMLLHIRISIRIQHGGQAPINAGFCVRSADQRRGLFDELTAGMHR